MVKFDPNEGTKEALARELDEELGIQVSQLEPFMQIEHDYTDKHVFLEFWQVLQFSGEAIGREGQQIKWVELEQIEAYEFPEANKAVVNALLKHPENAQ